MPNYGDIRLNLPADFDRSRYVNPEFIHMTVGHKEGIADAHLTKDPEQRHAFAWVDPNNSRIDEVSLLRDDGYDFVKKGSWTINRWNWNAEEQCYCQGQILMAISEEKWRQLEDRRAKRHGVPTDPIDESLHEIAARNKAFVTEGDGIPPGVAVRRRSR